MTDITQIQAVTIVITAVVSAAETQLAKLLGVREHGYYQEEREWGGKKKKKKKSEAKAFSLEREKEKQRGK